MIFVLSNFDDYNQKLSTKRQLTCSKNESEVITFGYTVFTFGTDNRMVFRLKNSGMVVLNRGKTECMDWKMIPPKMIVKWLEEKSYKYLGILELDKLMEKERRNKTMLEYLPRMRRIHKSDYTDRIICGYQHLCFH